MTSFKISSSERSKIYRQYHILLIQIFVIFFVLNLMYGSEISAQTISTTVDLELNALPDEKREDLRKFNFKQVLEDYLNNYKWTKDEFVGELDRRYRMMNGVGLAEGWALPRLDAESFVARMRTSWGQPRQTWKDGLGPVDAWQREGN